MITLVPAAPGTFIIELVADSNQLQRTPVVAWQHVQGNLAFPVTVMPFNGLTHGKAVEHANGYVDDPTHRLTFANTIEWQKFIGSVKPPAASPTGTKAEAGPTEPESEEPRQQAAVPERESIYVVFGKKTYKTKSFWAWTDGATDAIFVIEGDQPYPHDQLCSKITREEFAKLKAGGTLVVNAVPAQADMGGDVDEDDDGMDLV